MKTKLIVLMAVVALLTGCTNTNITTQNISFSESTIGELTSESEYYLKYYASNNNYYHCAISSELPYIVQLYNNGYGSLVRDDTSLEYTLDGSLSESFNVSAFVSDTDFDYTIPQIDLYMYYQLLAPNNSLAGVEYTQELIDDLNKIISIDVTKYKIKSYSNEYDASLSSYYISTDLTGLSEDIVLPIYSIKYSVDDKYIYLDFWDDMAYGNYNETDNFYSLTNLSELTYDNVKDSTFNSEVNQQYDLSVQKLETRVLDTLESFSEFNVDTYDTSNTFSISNTNQVNISNDACSVALFTSIDKPTQYLDTTNVTLEQTPNIKYYYRLIDDSSLFDDAELFENTLVEYFASEDVYENLNMDYISLVSESTTSNNMSIITKRVYYNNGLISQQLPYIFELIDLGNGYYIYNESFDTSINLDDIFVMSDTINNKVLIDSAISNLELTMQSISANIKLL